MTPTPAAKPAETAAESAKRPRHWLEAFGFKSLWRARHGDNSLKQALEEVLEEHQEESGPLPPEEQDMLKNVLEFGSLTVADIMTPRGDIKAVEQGIALPELKSHIAQYGHTRIPVYQETLDALKGFLHIKDLVPLLDGDTPFQASAVLRDILFVPPSMKLMTLLVTMRKTGVHMAIVVDEYGGTDGLATLEDVFEEIVGDIHDEHDEEEHESRLAWNEQRYCDLDAITPMEKLQEELGLQFTPDDEEAPYDTLGGLIFHLLGRVPVAGERVAHPSGVTFQILSADPRRIKRVRIGAASDQKP